MDELESYLKTKKEKDYYWWTIEYSTKNKPESEEILSTVATLSDCIGSYIFTENNSNKLFLRADYDSSEGIDELLYKVEHILREPNFRNVDLTRCY
ncbi:MAG: hypothetical protein IJQ57_06865, partial [Synergistaceae bacterium]|nr:hypothetical protein [Synergistaceae bacterium]